MMDCDVCQGRQTIRLPVSQRLSTAGFMENDSIPLELDAEALQTYSREFPCPQCTEQIPYSRLMVVRETSYIDLHQSTDRDKAAILEHHKCQAARMMVDKILRENLMIVEEVPTARGKQARLTLGIVSPKHVAVLEERVAERQFEMAEEVVSLTTEEIANWGSYYNGRMGGRVDAGQAVDWLRSALKKLKEKYNAPRRVEKR